MRVVLDSNVLFSALIKDSFTRKKILEYERYFLFPEIIFQEFEKYKEELRKKTRMTPEDFYALLELLLKKVEIVPTSELIPFKKKSLEIIKDIDIDDMLFIACALSNPGSIIWSDDKKLKNQNVIKIYNTKEISNIL